MRPAQPALGVRPQLVGEPAPSRTRTKLASSEQRQREAGDGYQRQRDVGDEGAAEADQRPGDDRPHRCRQAVEELVEVAGEVGLDVEDREAEHEDEAGQHEAEAGEKPAELAAAEATEVHAELVRLGPGQDLVDGEESS